MTIVEPEIVHVPVPGREDATYQVALRTNRNTDTLTVLAFYNGWPRPIGELHPVPDQTDHYVAEVLQQRSAPLPRQEALALIVKFVTSFK